MRSYSELILIDNYTDRLEYLKLLDNNVDSPRDISERFYKSDTWLYVRKTIIDRDHGFDLGIFGLYIDGVKMVHHINPITEFDIIYQTYKLTDPENLITVSIPTHNKIHYNNDEKEEWVERSPGDTKLW